MWRTLKSEKGSAMVEATIYFPIVVAIVMFILYMGLLKLQEAAFIYSIERVAQYGANEVAYPGYSVFSAKISPKINFDWSAGKPIDNQAKVREYYEKSHANIANLYNEITGSPWITQKQLSDQLDDVTKKVNVLSVASGATYRVDKSRSFWGTDVIVSVEYKVDTIPILQYIGLKPSYSYKRAAYSSAVNPTGFARNIDLAVDGLKWLGEQLGINVDECFSKFSEAADKYF